MSAVDAWERKEFCEAFWSRFLASLSFDRCTEIEKQLYFIYKYIRIMRSKGVLVSLKEDGKNE